jgi:hypothetical protein
MTVTAEVHHEQCRSGHAAVDDGDVAKVDVISLNQPVTPHVGRDRDAEWRPVLYCLPHGPSVLRGCCLCSYCLHLPYICYCGANQALGGVILSHNTTWRVLLVIPWLIILLLTSIVWVCVTFVAIPLWIMASLVMAVVEAIMWCCHKLTCRYCNHSYERRWRIYKPWGDDNEWYLGNDPYSNVLVRSWSPFPGLTSFCYPDPNI